MKKSIIVYNDRVMSKWEDFLKKECPDGVEYKQIKDIAKINRGIIISKKYIEENKGDYPVYSSQTENNGELGRINNYAYDGEYLTWTTDGANAGSVFYRNEKFNITNVCGLIKITEDNIITKFVYYILHIYAPKYVNRGMGNCKLMSNVMESISIPIPPIEVQKEIVGILDTFTKYQDLLNRELELRKKQYEYYREKLLTFGEDVELKKLADVSEIKRGIRVVKSQLSNNYKYPVYQNSLTPLGFYKNSNVDCNTSFIITAGAAGEIGYSENSFWAADDCFYFKSSNIILNKYIYYFLLSKKHYLYSQVRRASIPRLSRNTIENLKIPVPPLEEQERIVKILDQFDTLCNDITRGLPAEIELRKKQYEYYRDKLLTFKEKKK